MVMKTTWIVAADASRARVLQRTGRARPLVAVEDLFNLGRYLQKARQEGRYDELVVVAPPRLLGTLRGELGREVEKLVAEEIPRDLSGLTARELSEYFEQGSARAL